MNYLIVMAVMLFSLLCSFSAYSHPVLDDDIPYYEEVNEKRFNSAEFSSVFVYYEEGFFTNSYYLHYHVYERDQVTNLKTHKPRQNGEYTMEISRDDYDRIIHDTFYKVGINPGAQYFDNRVIFY